MTIRLNTAESVTVYRRGAPLNRQRGNQPLPVMLMYVYDVEGGPLEVNCSLFTVHPLWIDFIDFLFSKSQQISGKTSINLNEELISLGMAKEKPVSLPLSRTLPDRPRITAWKPAEFLPVNTVFWAKGTWVNMKGEIFLQDVRVSSKVKEIEDLLSREYRDSKPSPADLKCKAGDLCIAK